MVQWEEMLWQLDGHIKKVENPIMFSRLQGWKRRLSHVRARPHSSCLEDVSDLMSTRQPVKTIDLSTLYPVKRRAA